MTKGKNMSPVMSKRLRVLAVFPMAVALIFASSSTAALAAENPHSGANTVITTPPTVAASSSATNIDTTSATLSGTINPNGTALISAGFTYGTNSELNDQSTTVSIPDFANLPVSSDNSVSVDLSGLKPHTHYYYKLGASNRFTSEDGHGTVSSPIYQFTTLAGPQTVTFMNNCQVGCAGVMDPQTSDSPANLTLNTFTQSGKVFTGWRTSASKDGSSSSEDGNGEGSGTSSGDGSGTSSGEGSGTSSGDGSGSGSSSTYADGALYNFGSSITLYAQWAVASSLSQTISVTSDASTLNYYQTTTLGANGYSGSGAISYNLVSGNCTLVGATLTATGSTGSCSVTATIAADASSEGHPAIYLAATSTPLIIDLSKGILLVTPDSQSVMAGMPAPAYTFTVSGFVNGEDSSSVFGYTDPTCTSSYTTSTLVADSPVAITCDGATATDYTFTYLPASLTVIPYVAYKVTYVDPQGLITGASPVLPTQSDVPGGTTFIVDTYYSDPANQSQLPVLAGYNFGWTDGTNDYLPGDFSLPVNSDVTLTAEWIAATPITPGGGGTNVTVTFDPNGGDGVSYPQSFSHGTPAQLIPNVFTRANFTFMGWNSAADGSGTSYAESGTYGFNVATTLYAIWQAGVNAPTIQAITYLPGAGGGTAPASPLTVAKGSTFTTPTNTFIYTGHVFAAWTDGVNTYAAGVPYPVAGTVSGDITLTATWVSTTLNITYSSGAGTGTGPSAPLTVAYGSTFITPTNTFTYPGHTFTGWFDGSNTYGVGATYPAPGTVSTNVTLTAQWTALATYALTYTAGANGTISGSSSQIVASGSSGTAVTAVAASGYHFVSWNDSSTTNPRTDSNVTADITVSASFAQDSAPYVPPYVAPTTYTVTYIYPNGMSGTVPTHGPVTAGTIFAVDPSDFANPPTKDGFNFGWSDGTTNFLPGDPYTMPAKNVTFTAEWIAAAPKDPTPPTTPPSTPPTTPPSTPPSVPPTPTPPSLVAPTAYTVTFDTQGRGKSIPPLVGVKQITFATLPSGSASGLTFSGWSLTPAGSILTADFVLTENITLYAVWLAFAPTSPTPLPTTTPDPTVTPALNTSVPEVVAAGVLIPHASKKKLLPNQIVALSESIKIIAPEGTTLKDLVINNKVYVIKASSLTNIPVPVLVGPKDKIIVELVDPNAFVIEVPVKQQLGYLALANVNFDLGTATLTAAAKKVLDLVVKDVKARGYTFIDLTGYTDAQGATSGFNNQALSQVRVKAVSTYLKSKFGKTKVAIKVEAKAHLNPVGSNKTAAGQLLNRRVDVAVH